MQLHRNAKLGLRDRRELVLSGTVEALGWGTTGFATGDAVYGLTDWYRDGALAEYVAVEARNLAPKPASLDHVQAAALPMGGSPPGRLCSSTADCPEASGC